MIRARVSAEARCSKPALGKVVAPLLEKVYAASLNLSTAIAYEKSGPIILRRRALSGSLARVTLKKTRSLLGIFKYHSFAS